MAEDIVVIGAGGFGRETLDVIEAINAAEVEPAWRIRGVIDDLPGLIQRERLRARGVDWLGPVNVMRGIVDECRYIVGIGSPAVKAHIVRTLDRWGGRAATLVHPAAVVGSHISVGYGSVVCGGVQLSTNVRLATHVHVNPGAVIGHDVILDDFVSVNPGAIISGEVRVNTEALVGAAAVVLQGLTVGAGAVVGAGACVTRDVASGTTVVGVPARTRTALAGGERQ